MNVRSPLPDSDRSAELMQLVERATDYAIFLLDTDGRVRSWNLGAERIKGYRAEEIIGSHFSRFYTAEDLAAGKPDRELAAAAVDGRFEDEGFRVRKDGSRFWANVIITALHDEHGTLCGFGKMTRDLSERRAVEEALRQSEERFRLLVEGVRDYGVFRVDVNGRVASWNAGAERMTGYAAREVLGQHFALFYPPEDIAVGKPDLMLRRTLAEGRCEDESWRVRKDGSRFWANSVVTVLRDPASGELRGFAKITRDLTERRRAEEELLQQQLARVRAESDRRHAEGELRRRDEFLSVASHELRTPMTTLRLQLETLRRLARRERQGESAPEAPPDEVGQLGLIRRVDAALRQVERLERLVTDFVDVPQLAERSFEVRRAPTSVEAVCREVLAREGAVWAGAGSPVSLRAAGNSEGEFDAAQLGRLVHNLIANAAKFGRGHPVEVGVTGTARSVVLSVRDQGIGVADEDRRRIFERFERAASADHFGGLGLGLWICREIVEAHGGTIRVESVPGAGATFLVELPRSPR